MRRNADLWSEPENCCFSAVPRRYRCPQKVKQRQAGEKQSIMAMRPRQRTTVLLPSITLSTLPNGEPFHRRPGWPLHYILSIIQLCRCWRCVRQVAADKRDWSDASGGGGARSGEARALSHHSPLIPQSSLWGWG